MTVTTLLILTSCLAAGASCGRCFHQYCTTDTGIGNYIKCNQSDHICLFGDVTGAKCEYQGFASEEGYVWCWDNDNCRVNRTTGQAYCSPADTWSGWKLVKVIGIVLVIGAVVIVAACCICCFCCRKGIFKNRRRNVPPRTVAASQNTGTTLVTLPPKGKTKPPAKTKPPPKSKGSAPPDRGGYIPVAGSSAPQDHQPAAPYPPPAKPYPPSAGPYPAPSAPPASVKPYPAPSAPPASAKPYPAPSAPPEGGQPEYTPPAGDYTPPPSYEASTAAQFEKQPVV